MLGEFDLFAFYRWLLAIVCGIYTILRLGQTLQTWTGRLWSAHPRSRTLRRYAAVQLLRINVRRFTLDLVQIAALASGLGVLLWLHHRWGFVG